MSKVLVLNHVGAKDTFPVSAALITTGFKAGVLGTLNSTASTVAVAAVDNALFVFGDGSNECVTPPNGAEVTCIYGSGSKFIIDHSTEVAAADATRAYETDVESATIPAALYCSVNGKFTASATGSVKGHMFQKPVLANNFGLGVLLRM